MTKLVLALALLAILGGCAYGDRRQCMNTIETNCNRTAGIHKG